MRRMPSKVFPTSSILDLRIDGLIAKLNYLFGEEFSPRLFTLIGKKGALIYGNKSRIAS